MQDVYFKKECIKQKYENKIMESNLNDITGQRFGKLTVIKLYDEEKKSYWLCECDCGKQKIVYESYLKSGNTKSCGCSRTDNMRNNANGLLNKRFGRLIVLSISHVKNRRYFYLCKCDCGNEKVINGSSLSRGNTLSCGCLQKENRIKHGQYNSNKAEYNSWHSMISRCSVQNKDYGGRGITVCDEWENDFAAFLQDMGKKPSKNHSIDRIDNNKGYYKENCRWATNKEQSNNKRNNCFIEYNNEKLTISQWADKLNIKKHVIYHRINDYGWTIEKTLTTPVKIYNKINQEKGGVPIE